MLNRKLSLLLAPAILLIALLPACRRESRPDKSAKVYIDQRDGRYTLIRNSKPFQVKGAGGYAHFRELHEAGGNTMRTWDTTRLAEVLDSAARYQVAVIVGLPIPNSGDMVLYQSDDENRARLQAFRSVIRRYRDHPSVLMWCLGNELDFPYKWTYAGFYDAFNAITDMIHREDPDHPVTTTVLNFNPKYIFNLLLRCDIDLISFNIFGTLPMLRQNLADLTWLWKGPYMLLEWGINGPWQGTPHTAWGAYIEDTGNKKAEIYEERYQQSMPVEDPRFLGACVFFWGNKQETTHTWFSIFDENGYRSEAVSAMQGIWTGRRPAAAYPQLKYMLLNGQGARDNILLTPGAQASAEVLMPQGRERVRSVQWEIYREDWYRRNQVNSTRKLIPLTTFAQAGDSLRLTFPAPEQEGPYRVFARIYDGEGHFASCNTPFYVVRKP